MKTIIILALTGLTIVVPTAVAETEAPVAPSQVGTVSSETTGEPCGTVTRSGHTISGGCAVHAQGTATLTSHTIFGEIVGARCDAEATGHIGTDANGWIGLNDISITEAATNNLNCTHEEGGVQKCSEADAAAIGHPGDVQISGFEDQSNGSIWGNAEICLENTSLGDVDGDLWVRLNEGADGHVSSGSLTDHRLREESVVGEIEFSGNATVEGDTIEVDH